MQAYSDPRREDDPHSLPDVEVFYFDSDEAEAGTWEMTDDGEIAPSGWYYWSCFPGCLPDSDPVGPFATEAEALADAREGVDE